MDRSAPALEIYHRHRLGDDDVLQTYKEWHWMPMLGEQAGQTTPQDQLPSPDSGERVYFCRECDTQILVRVAAQSDPEQLTM